MRKDWPVNEEIVDAISMEARENAKPIDCEVLRTRQVGALWEVWLEPFQMREHLDESLEGATLWWPGPPKGSADILSVVPDEWQINLRFASSPPPRPGGKLKIYAPQFLNSLETLWQDAWWVEQCLRVQNALGGFANSCVGAEAHSRWFPWLRTAQQRTFGLTKFEHGFLWGPPGTGKTITLGAVVASYLVQFPKSRILLFSTTNVAVDQALLAVDDALQRIPQLPPDIRNRCQRIGNHFRAALYKDRRRLLPVVGEAALQRLVQLEASRPDPADTWAYDRWKTAAEQARKALQAKSKDILRNARLAAMTTTLAVFNAEELGEMAPYDLVIFDEASQVSVPHALALATLGRSVTFAGDPRQLEPIVQSNSA